MSKKLAIKGHSTRGKEVIELLEMMGGTINEKILSAANIGDVLNPYVYFFDPDSSDNRIVWYYLLGLEHDGRASEMMIFTLEEFLEKYPFKVGDKVIDKADGCPGVVSEMKWDEDVSDMKYFVAFGNGIDFGWFANDSIEFCKENENLEETQSNQDIDKDVFRKEFCERCGSQRCSGQDDELEYCERFKNLIDNLGKMTVKNHKMGPKSKLPSKYYEDKLGEIKSKREYDELRMPLDDNDKLATEATIMGKKILPPDGYLVGKITRTDNGMLVEYVEKKPKYPTTYEECCEVIMGKTNFSEFSLAPIKYSNTTKFDNEVSPDAPHIELFNNLYKLYICRNAYWKIYGEETGLGKPWKPDWNDGDNKFVIQYLDNEVGFWLSRGLNYILAFPTVEMRDAFYENFKKEIEQCKELL